MKNILILLAHPDAKESFGAALAHAYADGARQAGAHVEVMALSTLSLDPLLRDGFRSDQELEPDLRAAREAIERADHIVFEFPVWWGSMPALLRGFIDRTFLPGWAFRHDGGPLPTGLLAGRSAHVIATMDSPRIWYWFKHRRAAHRSLVHATLHYVGIKHVQETTLYEVRMMDAKAREAQLARLRTLGAKDARRPSIQRTPPQAIIL